MSGICFAAGTVCLLYYLILVIYAGITAYFSWIWLLTAFVLYGGGILIRYGKMHPGFFPGWLRYAAAFILIVGILAFSAICAGVIRGMQAKGSEDLEYVVVLGAQVKGDKPSRALKKRLDAALEYAGKNPDTILILSGGQGSGEDNTEAKCMEEYLTEHGIFRERLVLEEKSTNTRENLVFSDELTNCAKARTGILSNNFHVYRAVKLAEKLGYEAAEGIAAPSDAIMQVHYVVREVFALVKEKIAGNL